MPLLELENLQTHFDTPRGVLKAVDGVSLSIDRGEILAVVGENGSGKTVMAFSILGLISHPQGKIVGGSIRFAGRELIGISAEEMRALRGAEISMIFQDSMASLNPSLTVGEQIGEAFIEHKRASQRTALLRAVELLELVGVPDPQRKVHEYPHRLSSGMRQRVMIAMALACQPKLLIADEPTAALDVTIQAQILELLREITGRTRTAIMLITHDVGVAAAIADRVAVMYAGRKVEEAPVARLLGTPLHPYTRELLASLPGTADDVRDRAPLREIPGVAPRLDALPAGCAFAPRCSEAIARCARERPELAPLGASTVACFVARARRANVVGAVQ
jgi:peptide/nickel transport system ATP-binding protein